MKKVITDSVARESLSFLLKVWGIERILNTMAQIHYEMADANLSERVGGFFRNRAETLESHAKDFQD